MNLGDLGQRIRSRREKCGLRQNDLAGALQVSPQAVSKWERGENAPDIALLAPLARLLGVSVDWLLGSFAQERDVFEATVLASGVRGAREKSEAMTPRDFAAWTSAVCFQVTEAALRHDGVPIKTLGPGILAFFAGADHRKRAAQAALSARVQADVPLKIGLASGEIYFGAVGHPDYSHPDIMGEATSIALLAMDWAAEHTPGGIVACAAAVAGLAGELALGKVRRVRFPGISHEVALHEIEN